MPGSVKTEFGWVEGNEDDEDGYVPRSDNEILNYVTLSKARAFDWITDGCPSLSNRHSHGQHPNR